MELRARRSNAAHSSCAFSTLDRRQRTRRPFTPRQYVHWYHQCRQRQFPLRLPDLNETEVSFVFKFLSKVNPAVGGPKLTERLAIVVRYFCNVLDRSVEAKNAADSDLRIFSYCYPYSAKMALDFIAGCIGGCAGIIAGHPLDTLKVHVQSGRGSALECTKALLKGGTLSAAYRGVGAPLGGIAAVNAIVFGGYGNTRRALPNPDSLRTHAIAGAAAGMLQSFACSPVELVKTRQQLARPSDGMPSGAWAGARHILRTGGQRALFRGLGVTMARDSPAFAIYFTSYEAMTRGDLSAVKVFMAGGMAGTLSWVLLYPIDVVKSRFQGDAVGRYAGAWDCFKQSVKTDSWRCMGRGLGAVTLRAFISNGACFTAVAWTERAWQRLFADGAGAVTTLAAAQAAAIGDAVRHDSPDLHFEM